MNRLALALSMIALVAFAFALPVNAGSSTRIRVGPNIDISNLPRAQFSPAIAINPNNPSEIVAASQDRSEFVPRVNGSLARA